MSHGTGSTLPGTITSSYLSSASGAGDAQKRLLESEIFVGLGIALVGALIGGAYGWYKNRKNNVTGNQAIESDLLAAFWGALVGIIIAIISILLYRIFFHAQNVSAAAKQQQLLQQLELQRLQQQITPGVGLGHGTTVTPAQLIPGSAQGLVKGH